MKLCFLFFSLAWVSRFYIFNYPPFGCRENWGKHRRKHDSESWVPHSLGFRRMKYLNRELNGGYCCLGCRINIQKKKKWFLFCISMQSIWGIEQLPLVWWFSGCRTRNWCYVNNKVQSQKMIGSDFILLFLDCHFLFFLFLRHNLWIFIFVFPTFFSAASRLAMDLKKYSAFPSPRKNLCFASVFIYLFFPLLNTIQ